MCVSFLSVCDYVGSVFECYNQRENVYMRECAPWMVTRPARAPYINIVIIIIIIIMMMIINIIIIIIFP